MKILVSGSSGLIGKALVSALTATGSQVFNLKRSKNTLNANDIFWSPEQGLLDKTKIEGFDVIINLAGETIAGRWSASKKEKILDSRILSSSLLAKSIASLKSPPELFINASAIGYYGNCGDEELTEKSPPGTGFLASVSQQWEAAIEPARSAGVRTALLRTGIVLSTDGGALKSMLFPFRIGLGGVIGSGRQWMSWIAIDDLIAAIFHIIQHKSCRGPFNLVAPKAVTNAEFTKTLGAILQRPTFLPVPAFIIKALLGEMGETLLLESIHALPQRLLQEGYHFTYPNLVDALKHLLSKQ